jgi:hypothetical protein
MIADKPTIEITKKEVQQEIADIEQLISVYKRHPTPALNYAIRDMVFQLAVKTVHPDFFRETYKRRLCMVLNMLSKGLKLDTL